jgi:hypothetical protein
MTDNARRLTDDVLRRALSELAAGPDADLLLTDVLRAVDGRTQVGRRPWDTRGWSRAALLVAATLLLVAATIGATVVLTRPQPQPTPQPSASATAVSRPMPTSLPLNAEQFQVSDFVVPFTYHLPVGVSSQLIKGGDVVYYVDARGGESGRLTLFPVSSNVHGCGSSSGNGLPTSGIADEPTAFFEELRNTVGAGIGPVSTTTLGNLRAVGADIVPNLGTCSHATLHVDRLGLQYGDWEPRLSSPGHLIVARTRGTTIGVHISAPTEDALASWLPIALAYVNGLEFEAAP